MEDIDIVRKCAERMGYTLEPYSKGIRLRGEDGYVCMVIGDSPIAKQYDPLHDRAQAMDLVIKFGLFIDPPDWQPVKGWNTWQVNHYAGGKVTEIRSEDLLRAICECVANIKGTT